MGSGFKTFTAGEVLTASDVNNYLMEQSVMTFGGSAARSSAIGTANFEEGMVSYLTDTDKVEAYNGTNWVSVAPTSTQGLTLINTTSFSGVASISIPQDTFTSTYRNYHIRLNVAGSAATFLKMKLRAAGVDTTASSYVWSVTRSTYASGAFGGYSGNGVDFFEITDLTNSTTDVFDSQINIYRPKDAVVTNIAVNGRGSANGATFISGSFNATTSFDAITLFPNTGNITGFIQVYGCNQ